MFTVFDCRSIYYRDSVQHLLIFFFVCTIRIHPFSIYHSHRFHELHYEKSAAATRHRFGNFVSIDFRYGFDALDYDSVGVFVLSSLLMSVSWRGLFFPMWNENLYLCHDYETERNSNSIRETTLHVAFV